MHHRAIGMGDRVMHHGCVGRGVRGNNAMHHPMAATHRSRRGKHNVGYQEKGDCELQKPGKAI
jgi:hypothetical protein